MRLGRGAGLNGRVGVSGLSRGGCRSRCGGGSHDLLDWRKRSGGLRQGRRHGRHRQVESLYGRGVIAQLEVEHAADGMGDSDLGAGKVRWNVCGVAEVLRRGDGVDQEEV